MEVESGTRDEMLGRLAGAIQTVKVAHPIRVAIDGPPASGKTTLADEVAGLLRGWGRNVIRATVDDFIFPRERRYRRGEFSAEGCYFDAHDIETLKRVLLDPLGPGGDRRFQHKSYDHTADVALSPPVTTAHADAVLIFDGVFLMRPELVDRWDLRILVSTELEKTVCRALIRDGPGSSAADVERRWRERYIPSQRLYFGLTRPATHADFVLHNDEPERPSWQVRTH